MTAQVRAKHRHDAATLWASLRDDWRDPADAIAQALADAEEYGVIKALHRLGPIIADAEVAREQLASEVDL